MALGDVSQSLAPTPPDYMDDAAIRRKRALADALLQQGMDTSPIRSPWQGAARLVQGLLGGIHEANADNAERENNKYNSELMQGLMGGQSASGTVSPAPSASPAMLTPNSPAAGGVADGGDMGRYRDAIAAIESRGSGDYAALGPKTRTGDQAFGRYQVMGENVPSWTKEALGYSMTPQQFVSDPKAQDAVFDKRFGGYMAQGGPQNAASMWFTGKPLAQGANRADVNGVTGNAYVDKFTKALGPSQAPVQVASNDANQAFASAAAPSASQSQGNGQAQRILAAMADPRLSPQNKQILTMMYQNAVKQDSAAHRHVVNGALVDDGGNVLYKGETKPEPRTELQRDLEYVQQHPEAKPYFEKKYGQSNSLLDQAEQRKQLIIQQGGNPDDAKTQQFINTGRYPREDAQPLTPTDKKAILEADELVQSNEAGIQALQKAKQISPQAYGGWGAGARAQIGLNAPDMIPDFIAEPNKSASTQDLENIVVGNALNSLKSTFGGNPTEGERAILLQLQGSVGQPDVVRQNIYDRAIEMAQRRLEFNKKRAGDLRGQQYYEPGHNPDVPKPPGGDELQAARDAIARGKDRNAVIQRLREHGIDPAGL